MGRIDFGQVFPAAMQSMVGLEKAVHASSLESSLLELVKMRASQINGCAHCLDMHSKDARAQGETEQRLYLLNAWHEAPCYSDRERAALAWCEQLTRIADGAPSDEAYAELTRHFNDEQIVALTLSIVAINGWNRFAISLQSPVGEYVSPYAATAHEPAHT